MSRAWRASGTAATPAAAAARAGIRCLAAMLALAAPGCAFEVSEPQGSQPAALFLVLEAADGPGASRVTVRAEFRPGLDDEGRPRAVSRDSLDVLGIAIAPSRTLPGGGLFFEYELDLGLALERFNEPLLPPAADGIATGPLRAAVQLLRIDAGDTVTAGAELALPLDRPAGPPPDSVQGLWRLRIREDTMPGAGLTVEGPGPPPDTIRLPASLLPAGPATLVLRVWSSHQMNLAGGDFVFGVAAQTTAVRALRLVGPDG